MKNPLQSTPNLGQKAIAELVGTFLFVFVGAGSAVALGYLANAGSNQGLIVTALANGLGLGIGITATMSISGGSLNPAVTIGLLVARKLSIAHAIVYIISEVAGATIAGFLLISVLPQNTGNAVGWGAPALSKVSVAQGIALEAIMTFILVFTVFGTAVDSRAPKVGGFAIGLIVAADVMVGGPFTGAAMNPARAIGPEFAWAYFAGSGALTNWYVWWVGPIIGGVIAAFIYGYVILRAN